MQLWLIVPVKPLIQGKSRLSPLLSASERHRLSRNLLVNTLAAAVDVDLLARVLVISRDEEALTLARAAGVMVLVEDPHWVENGDDPEDPLNRALRQARTVALSQGADAILVLPADLPLISAAEIRRVAQLAADQAHGLVIAASGDGGTNALLLRPPNAIDFAYGPNSFEAHIRNAQAVGLPVEIVESAALALDLDSPEDLHTWQKEFTAEDRK
jgi:2-phospho-L-lactate/phosphoenolpyruvate guanylyltransferase